MNESTIENVTQSEFDEAVQLIISGLKASDPKLDTRIGTVLRSLLVNPEARINAATAKQIEYTRKSSSLKLLKEAEENGEEIDTDDVNAVLSNFNLKSINGTYAEGLVKITVESGEPTYIIPEGTNFSTIDGLVFTSTGMTIAAQAGYGSASVNTTLYKGISSYFFLVPVVASEVGASYNIIQGTSLTLDTAVFSFINAEAYSAFNGGSDIANLQETVNNIPASLSIRGFVNKNACEGMLRDQFDEGKYPIIACSTVGYGNGAQRRDKHNPFGVGIGGRIDLYVRNFGDLYTITKTVTGKKIEIFDENGSLERVDYSLEVTPDMFPGNYWVKEISSTSDINSSLEFKCTRGSYGVESTWHDFDVSKNTSETFNTMWQSLHVTAMEVPPDTGDSTSSSADDEWSDDRTFRVTVYCLPQAAELQEYVDRNDIRSVSTDVVVRCPIICNVTVSANVIYDTKKPLDAESIKYKIRKYINGLGFVKSLTRSEIVHIIKDCGAVSVDLGSKDMLYGTLYDSFGKEYNLSGDSLQLDGLAGDSAMLSKDTTVFAAEPENIQIALIPNE